jgi:hypothetical protein
MYLNMKKMCPVCVLFFLLIITFVNIFAIYIK